MDNSENIEENKNFEILSGQAGSGGGVGYVPIRYGMYEYSIGFIRGRSGGAPAAGSHGTLGALNAYSAWPFKLQRDLKINRLSIRCVARTAGTQTIRGGIMQFDTSTGYPTQVSSVITFVTNAYQDKANSDFTATAYTTFSFAADVTLSANTWYFAGVQAIAHSGGSVQMSAGSSLHPITKWPTIKQRNTGSEANSTTTQLSGIALGYFDGSTTKSYLFTPSDLGTAIGIFTAATTNTQVGFKIEINLPINEIYVTRILFTLLLQNTAQSLICKIYSDVSGSTLVASSVVMHSYQVRARANTMRMFHFAPPVALKCYKTYYVVIEVSSGSATNTNPSSLYRINLESSDFYSWDSLNNFIVRSDSADANFTVSTDALCDAIIYFNTVRPVPRPHFS